MYTHSICVDETDAEYFIALKHGQKLVQAMLMYISGGMHDDVGRVLALVASSNEQMRTQIDKYININKSFKTQCSLLSAHY